MSKMKYSVIFDYGTYEGMRFMMNDKLRMRAEFLTVDEAVKAAIGYNSATAFFIVQVIKWEASNPNEK